MLAELPYELLAHIISYCDRARHLAYFALTCHRLHTFVEEEGWRVFIQINFPSIETPKFWKDASKALTAHSRNWDRRALIARLLQPSDRIIKWPGGSKEQWWSAPVGQTMGFQPAIDSYLEWSGASWSARREVLAYSAGAELIIRVKESEANATRRLAAWGDILDKDLLRDHDEPVIEWATHRAPTSVQGLDDITSLQLQRRDSAQQCRIGSHEAVVMGTASGSLMTLDVPLLGSDATGAKGLTYATQGRSVKSLDTSSGPTPMLAAALAGTHVALYPLSFPDNSPHSPTITEPINEIAAIPATTGSTRQQCWTLRFLSPERLAVGTGPSNTPLKVFQFREDGIGEVPFRTFHCHKPDRCHDGVDVSHRAPVTAAYQILPLSSFNANDQDPGDVFLTGFHDGFVTLNDMRSPRDYVQAYWDPLDSSAIYSLAAIGRERFLAGGSMNSSIKFFDLRMSGGQARYHEAHLTGKDRSHPHRRGTKHKDSDAQSAAGWNLFLDPRDEARAMRQSLPSRFGRGRGHGGRNIRPPFRVSPIYSLSSPSPCSPSMFAGLENRVVQIDLTSMVDQHPDPIFECGLVRQQENGKIDVVKTWDPAGDVLNLAMFEHHDEVNIGLMSQAGAEDALKREMWVGGYDERWRKGEKWKKDPAT